MVSCCPAELQTDGNGGKKEVLSGFQVVLEDTLLFPEGGGQVLGAASAPPKEPPHSSSLLQKMRSPFLSLSKSEGRAFIALFIQHMLTRHMQCVIFQALK